MGKAPILVKSAILAQGAKMGLRPLKPWVRRLVYANCHFFFQPKILKMFINCMSEVYVGC